MNKEREAIKSLKDNNDILVIPADKGRAVVVMNTRDYKTKAQELLEDVQTYKKLKSNPTSKYKTKLVKILQGVKQSGAISETKYRQLYPTSEEVPKFYGLPKVHKNACPLRPIVACRGSISYDVAKFTADIISPLVGQSGHHLQNSKDLVDKLKNFQLESGEVLVSYDVTALFTCTPVQESLTIIKDRLNNDNTLSDRTDLSVEQIMSLLEYCLTTTYFQYDGQFYQQLEGAAMGSPVSPITANLFMEDFETKALASYPNPPRFWGRYVDDTLAIIKADQIDRFTAHINAHHPAIKFTIEKEVDNKIPVLDVLISRDDTGQLSFQVYRKPTHTEQYLSFSSHHPLQHKLGVIRTLSDRATTIVSKEVDKQDELVRVRRSLAICGYKDWAWETATRNKARNNQRIPRHNIQRSKGNVGIPYVEGITESLQRLFRSHGVNAYVQPQNTLRSLLVAPKDKADKLEKCGAVYQVSCKVCPSTYVGESARPLKTRLDEHTRPSSPVGEHSTSLQHDIDWDGVKVLDKEDNWFRRGVKEAINIKRTNSDLNRDRGRHHLPSSYNRLISSRDSSPSGLGHVTSPISQ